MKIVVIGDGKVGFTLSQALSREGHDLVVVDTQKGALAAAADRLDVMVVEGNGASAAVQREAGVDESDLMIAATSADETNLLCCMVARKLGCRHTIARIRNPEYTEAQYLLREELGLSMAVNPEKVAAREIFGLLQFPSFIHRDAFAKGRAEIVAIPVAPGSRLDGVALTDLYRTLRVRVLVCAVERGNDVVIPDGRFVLRGGDHIFVTAPASDLLTLVKAMELKTTRIRAVMIVGGSRIAMYLSRMLTDVGIQVRLIESKAERCEMLGAALPQVQVIQGDGTSFQTLENEGLEDMDAMITLTNMDEQNLVVSMYAQRLGVPKVVTKINRVEYGELMRDVGADCIISPRLLVCNDILRYVRAMHNSQGDHMIALHRLVDGRVEALEFRASRATWYLATPLKNIPIRENILLAVISHRGKVVIPSGEDCFYEGDSVVVVTGTDRSLGSLNDIFKAPPAHPTAGERL